MADDQQGTSQAPVTNWAAAAAKYGGTVVPSPSTAPQASGDDATTPPIAKTAPNAPQKVLNATQDMDWAQAAAKYGGTVATEPQESDLHKAFLGPNTMLGEKVPQSFTNEAHGVQDVLSGNFRQGLGEIWDQEKPHVVPGSPLEKLIQKINPNFKGEGGEPVPQLGSKPPVDAAQFIDKSKHPIAKALAETAQSFLSPQSISLLVATGGAGMVESPAALGLASRLVSSGFAVQSIANAYKHIKAFKEAYDTGNTAEAEYQLTHAVVSGSMSALMAQHATTGEGPAENAWTKAGAKADAALGTAVKTVAGLPAKATQLIPDRQLGQTPAEQLQQGTGYIYDAIKPGKSAVNNDFKETLDSAGPQLSVVANRIPNIKSVTDLADGIEQHRVGIESQLKQKAFDTRGLPESSMTDLTSQVQDALNEAFEKEGMKYNSDQREQGVKAVMKQLGIESKMEKDPDTGDTMPTPYRTGPIPDLYNAEKIRQAFKEDVDGSYSKGNVPSGEVFAKQVAQQVLRDAIDQKYEHLGISGVKEWRKQETGLITVRDALYNARDHAEKAGQGGLLDSFMKRKGWGSVPAVVGAVMGGAPGAILGELSSAGLDWFRGRQVNPNILIPKAMEQLRNAGESPDAALPKQVEEHIDKEAEKRMLSHGEEEKGPKLPEDELREHYKDEVRDDMGLPTSDDLEKAESAETKTEAKPKITYDTDSLGIKWASQEGSPAKVSIPKNLEGAEADKYAQEKLDEQKAFAKSRETKIEEPKTEEVAEPKLEEKAESEKEPEESPSNNSAAFGAAAGINALSGRKEEEPKTVTQHRWGPVTWAAHEKTPVDIGETLDKASKEFNVPALLTRAQAHQESRFDTNAVSNKGARGIMQLMPKTSEALGVTDPHDPEQNIYGGVRYMSQLHEKFGTWDKTLAAYNAGPTMVQKLIREHGENWFDYLPQETKKYVHKILVESVR